MEEKTIFDFVAEYPEGGKFTEFHVNDEYGISIIQFTVTEEKEIIDFNEIQLMPGEYQPFLTGLDKAYRENLKRILKDGTDKIAN